MPGTQTEFPHTEFIIPATCIICGKVEKNRRVMHRLDKSFKGIKKVKTRLLGQYVCTIGCVDEIYERAERT